MAVTSTHPAIRWAVPGAIVAIALGATALTAISADATSTLPPRSAAELLVDVQTASLTSISGNVVQKADLGLPDLSQLAPGDSSDFTSLISGSHTLRVWYAGEDQQRLALLGTLGESDIVRNGTDLWTWSSETNAATHYQLPEQEPDATVPDAGALAITPQQAAEQALAAIDPSTAVTVDGTPSVAGRDAYELVLTPRDNRSLVGEIRIAVDAEKHIPLRVQVWAAGAGTPAFEVGFTQVSFDTPGAEQFQFTPPPGATVTESTLDESDRAELPGAPAPDLDAAGIDADPTGEPTVVGTGWTTVLVATLPQQALDGSTPEAAPAPESGSAPEGGPRGERPGSGIDLQSLVGSLPAVSGKWGSGHLLQSALFSVLVTDDGRVLGGAVAPELLYEAAAQ